MATATFRKRGPYQWQAQVRKKGYPLHTRTFETRAAAEARVRAIEVEMDKGFFVSRAEAESSTLSHVWHWKPLSARESSSDCAGSTWNSFAASPTSPTPES